jgi:tetratricopeptide (TPR) repeat protein
MDELIKVMNEILEEIKGEKFYYFPSAINRKIGSIKEEETKGYLEIISKCCSLNFNTKEQFNPFGQSLTELSDDEIKIIKQIIEIIPGDELNARLSDIVWVRNREIGFAENAIQKYLEVASRIVDYDDWVQCGNALERALRISSLFKKNKIDLFNSVIDNLENLLQRIDCKDNKFLSIHLIKLLYNFHFDNSKKYMILLSTIASDAENKGDFHKAEEAWLLLIDLNRDNESDKRDAYISLINCYVKHFDSVEEYMLKAHWLEKAVEVCKNVSDYKEERDKIYKKLTLAQKESLKELQTFETELPDLSDYVAKSISLIKDKNLEESLFSLAFKCYSIPDYDKIKKQTIDGIKDHPFYSLMGGIILDEEGKTVKRKPSLLSEDADQQESGLWNEIIQSVIYQHSLSVRFSINPIREEICKRYYFDENVFLNYCKNNPFIRPGQEYIFAKGLYSGLSGDFITSSSILIPLLENSLRFILEQAGGIISTLNTNNVQEVIRINAILNNSKLKERLGNNIINDLKCLLIEPAAYNFRNRVSHGLLSTYDFYQEGMIYLWALILRLMMVPVRARKKT